MKRDRIKFIRCIGAFLVLGATTLFLLGCDVEVIEEEKRLETYGQQADVSKNIGHNIKIIVQEASEEHEIYINNRSFNLSYTLEASDAQPTDNIGWEIVNPASKLNAASGILSITSESGQLSIVLDNKMDAALYELHFFEVEKDTQKHSPLHAEAYKIHLDQTPPAFSGKFEVRTNLKTGARLANINLTSNETSKFTCSEVSIISTNSPKIAASISSDNFSSNKLEMDDIALDSNTKGPYLLKLVCQDFAKNGSEIFLPASAQLAKFEIAAQSQLTLATPPGSSTPFFMSHEFRVEVDFKVIASDEKNGAFTVSSEQFGSLTQGWLIDISTALPTNMMYNKEVDENTKTENSTILRTSLLESLSIPLPNDKEGEIAIFLSFLKPSGEGEYELVETRKMGFYIDTIGPKATNLSKVSYLSSSKEAPMKVSYRVENEGAEISSLMLKLTQDDVAFKDVAFTNEVIAERESISIHNLTFRHPFAEKTAFKAKAIFIDTAGNKTETDISPILAGSYTAAYDGSDCFTAETPAEKKSLLKADLGLRKVCYQSNNDYPTVPIILSNFSNQSFSFYATEYVQAGIGYRVLVDDEVVFTSKILDEATLLGLTSGKKMVFNLPVNPDWLMADSLILELDAEESGALSTTNACYTPENRPRVTLISQPNNLTLEDSIFKSCEL